MPVSRTVQHVLSCCALLSTASLSSLASANGTTWVDLEDIASMLRGDIRIVWMGDSFCSTYTARVPGASLNTWPIDRISAIEGGAARYHGIIHATQECTPLDIVQASDSQGYSVERHAAAPVYFGLPVRGIQETFTSSDLQLGNNGGVLEFHLLNERLESGSHGRFSQIGEHVRMRYLFRCTSNPEDQLPSASLHDHTGANTQLDLMQKCRGFLHRGELPLEERPPIPSQINAAIPDIDAINDLDVSNRVYLSIDPASIGTNQYLDSAGAIYYQVDEENNRRPGMYFSYIADDSWSYRDFGDDESCTGTHDKVFTREQLTHWLDVTTLDPDQPILFAWLFAPESGGYTATRNRMENMLDLADAAVEGIASAPVRHLIIISHMINYTNDNGHYLIQAEQDAAFDIAGERDNVAAASIYAATDGITFDGSAESVQWLLAHGFDDFEYGTLHENLTASPTNGQLLDNGSLHPVNAIGGAFFATILGNMIREAGCPGDLKPDGTINVSDLLYIITRWQTSYPNDPDGNGIIGIGDLMIVLENWGRCWPVQAPFNTRD